MLLAASIAGGIPVSLYDTVPGIDRRNPNPRRQGHRPGNESAMRSPILTAASYLLCLNSKSLAL